MSLKITNLMKGGRKPFRTSFRVSVEMASISDYPINNKQISQVCVNALWKFHTVAFSNKEVGF
jgi:hypothetical protein